MRTRYFVNEQDARNDAEQRGCRVWKHFDYGNWARECGLFPFVTGTYDGINRDMGWGTAGAYELA